MDGTPRASFKTTYGNPLIAGPCLYSVLQNAIDKCDNENDATGSGNTEACKYLTVLTTATANQCKIAPAVDEVINGTMAKLPG